MDPNIDPEEPVTLFPVPTKIVEKLIELYSQNEKALESCDWCNAYFKKYTIKCGKCQQKFVNCLNCFNVGRFHCSETCCGAFICKKCKETHTHPQLHKSRPN